jgi:CheY-like chemotaxis protein/two-component sensor histidine kinase
MTAPRPPAPAEAAGSGAPAPDTRRDRMAALGLSLAGVAHELNNPLAAISGFAQLLLQSDLPPDDRSAVETIAHEARRAARIVRGLLDYSRRQEGSAREDLDLNELVRYIGRIQRYTMETHGIRFETILAASLPPLRADPASLEQVILNLVVNARHALLSVTPPAAPPRITVRTRADGELVIIEVDDNGPGIPPEHLENIWDPFWTTKPDGEGTGLGLSVVHGIVIAHGGAIDVRSDPSKGTTFTVTLPAHLVLEREEPAPDAPPPGAPVATRAAGTGSPMAAGAGAAARAMDVLVVDDEPSIVRFMTRYLGGRGHAVVGASTGEEALKLAAGASFDVVVCDLHLPGIDGVELIRRLRALPRGGQARYVLATGARGGPAERRGDARGGNGPGDGSADAVVAKPFDMATLLRLVEGAGPASQPPG